MTWALVLGGAANVFDDADNAIEQFGQPDLVVGVKDIWITYPTMHHVCTFHAERLEPELAKRRALGYADPLHFWTYKGVKLPRLPIPIDHIFIRGGSSGLLGAFIGIKVADRAVCAGIPLDPTMAHFHSRRRNKPWQEARNYHQHWRKYFDELNGKVKSMSGFTQKLLGAPNDEWIKHGTDTSGSEDTRIREAAES